MEKAYGYVMGRPVDKETWRRMRAEHAEIFHDSYDADIFSEKGDKVLCDLPEEITDGLFKDSEYVANYLKHGEIYTIERSLPHDWFAVFELQEFPGVLFNSLYLMKLAM